MREVFFCAEEDNSQYIGLWLEARLFELRFVESGRRLSRPQLSPFHRSPHHFSAANNIRQTPAPLLDHRRSGNKVFHFDSALLWKILISPSETQDVFGNKSPGRFLVVLGLHAAAHRLVSLQVCTVLPCRRAYLRTSRELPCPFNAFAPSRLRSCR